MVELHLMRFWSPIFFVFDKYMANNPQNKKDSRKCGFSLPFLLSRVGECMKVLLITSPSFKGSVVNDFYRSPARGGEGYIDYSISVCYYLELCGAISIY